MHINPRRRSRRLVGLAVLAVSITSRAGLAQDGVPRLPETVVTATRLPTSVERVGSSITVITEQQIRERQATSVADVLRIVPGLAISRSGAGVGTTTQVRIRGAEANQTLVLIDGVEVNDPGGGSEFDFGHLLASGIERIEVLRGPQSALYGSDAIGGVINIITRRGSGEPTGFASTEAGSFRTVRADAGVSGSAGLVDYSLYATGYRSDGISIASRKRGFDESDGYANRTVGGRFGFALLDNLRMDLTGRWTQDRLDTDGFSGTTSPNIAIDDRSDALFRQRIGRAQGTLDLLDGQWQHVAGISIADTRRDFRDNKVQTGTVDGIRRKLDYQTNLLYATEGAVATEHATVLGLEHEDERVISRNDFADVDRRLETTSIFAQQGITIDEALTITASGRHDWNDRFEDAGTYRLSAAYVLDTGTKLRASYGTGTKAPTIFELFGFTSTFIGNPNLVPEESKGWDAGVEQSFLEGRLVADIAYFDTRIENLIEGFGNTARNVPGESRTRGIEFGVTFRPLHTIDVAGSYTYMSTRSADGEALVRRPRHVASLTATCRFLDDRASATLGIDWNAETRDLQFFPFPQPSHRVVLDDYTLLRLAGTYRLTEHLQVFGRIENALNEQYEELFSFATPGRAAYVGVRASF